MCGIDVARGKILRSTQNRLLTLSAGRRIAMRMRKNLPHMDLLLLTGPWPVATVL